MPKRESLAVNSSRFLIFYSCFQNFLKFYRGEKRFFIFSKNLDYIKSKLEEIEVNNHTIFELTDVKNIYIVKLSPIWLGKERDFFLKLRKIIRKYENK